MGGSACQGRGGFSKPVGVRLYDTKNPPTFHTLTQSRKGTGFDWWLAAEDNLFQAAARLEVSGIMRGSARRVNGRLKDRMAQTERSDRSGLTAFIAVIEFGRPLAKVVRR